MIVHLSRNKLGQSLNLLNLNEVQSIRRVMGNFIWWSHLMACRDGWNKYNREKWTASNWSSFANNEIFLLEILLLNSETVMRIWENFSLAWERNIKVDWIRLQHIASDNWRWWLLLNTPLPRTNTAWLRSRSRSWIKVISSTNHPLS